MKKEINKIPSIDLQDKCENIYLVLREHKEARHWTNQEVADAIDVPVERIRKFFAGDLKNPNVFKVAALCMLFEVSLDTLLGNPHGSASGRDAEIARLQNENLILNLKLEHEKENVRRTEAALDRSDGSLKRSNTFNYILIAICAVMVVALMNYFGIDIANPNIGFVRDNYVLPMGIVVVAIILAGLATLIAMLVGMFKENRKKGEDKNGN